MKRTVQVNTRVDEQLSIALDRLAHLRNQRKAHLFYEAIIAYLRDEIQQLRDPTLAPMNRVSRDPATLTEVLAELDILLTQAEAQQQGQ
ncbi:MAG: hypothetical protein HC911_14155 [Chloroflexaceae bacterium]|nr:hypothetical protein [Chloroflexaceae bacterium]